MPRRRRRSRLVSPLTRRILAINLMTPALLVLGILYLDQFRSGLVDQKVEAVRIEANLIAGAIGETAFSGPPEIPGLEIETARQLVRRLVSSTGSRARLYDLTGAMVDDSRPLTEIVPFEPYTAEEDGTIDRLLDQAYLALAQLMSGPDPIEPYEESPKSPTTDFPEVLEALLGDEATRVRRLEDGTRIITVATPIQALRKVRGVLLLSTQAQDVEERVRIERITILRLALGVLGVTVLLSLFLAGTIARPVRRLAMAALAARTTHGRRVEIPDFSGRQDEIGDLSVALRDMTDALYARIEAIESFAADVSHELKNPLTSLRSALETISRSEDEEQRRRLIRICVRDIVRLNRLITDIADSSRLDAELARAEAEPVDMAAMARTLAEIHAETGGDKAKLELDIGPGAMVVAGIEDRLGQVARNLIDNALSFSPLGATVTIRLRNQGDSILFQVQDQGPGMPEDRLEKVFERFYSDRPAGERFGTHSGLGLAICRQIVEAHGGNISAGNALGPDGQRTGAIFTVELPRAG